MPPFFSARKTDVSNKSSPRRRNFRDAPAPYRTAATAAGQDSLRPRSSRGHFINASQPVERTGIADERQKLCEDGDELAAVVADAYIRGNVPLDLGFASPQRDKHAKRKQLASRHVDSVSRQVIAEAVRREETLNMQFVNGGGSVKVLDHAVADDLFLERQGRAQRDLPGL